MSDFFFFQTNEIQHDFTKTKIQMLNNLKEAKIDVAVSTI